MTYLPPDGGLSHLLSVVSDSKAVAQRIKDLQTATKEHTDAILQHQQIQRANEQAEKVGQATLARFNNERAEHQNQVAVDKAYIADRKRELDNTIKDIQARHDNLKNRENHLNVKAQELDQIHASLVNREVDIATRTKMVEGREQQVQQHAARNQKLIDHLRENGFISI